MTIIGVALAVGLAGVSGQADAVPPATAAARCELHVWPAKGFFGLPFSNGSNKGLLAGRASRKEIEGAMDELLSPAAQLAALRDVDLVGELRLPADTTVVEHPEPLDPKTLGKIRTRRAASSSSCYHELIVTGHMLVEDIVWGDRFSSDFSFRRFGDKAETKQRFGGSGGNKLKVLTLPQEARPSDTPQLVAGALKANFLEYAKNVRRRIEPKSRSAS